MMKTLLNLFDQANWEVADNYAKGTFKKILRDEHGASTVLLKLPKGFHMDAHSHVTTEQHFVLEGSYTSEGIRYPEGSYQIIYAHEDHGPFDSEDGAMVLAIWDPYEKAE